MSPLSHFPGRERVLHAEEKESWAELLPAGGKVVFTNGCFDMLHPGHIWQLVEARRSGDYLVVGLNSDSSVRRIKGKGRPLVPEIERGLMLAALRPVDLVLIFEQDTPLELIEAVRPKVLVKGSDYEEDEIIGAPFVRSLGGEIVRVPLLEGFSTTGFLQKLRGEM